MTKHRKHKTRTITKTVYRNIKPAEPAVNTSRVKEEIKELEQRKMNIREESNKAREGKKGLSKFFAGFGGTTKRLALNKEINEKKNILRAVSRTEGTRGQIQFLKQRTELEEAKSKFKEAQAKNRVNFNSPTAIRYEDLFK